MRFLSCPVCSVPYIADPCLMLYLALFNFQGRYEINGVVK